MCANLSPMLQFLSKMNHWRKVPSRMGTFFCLASRPDTPVPVFFNLTNKEENKP